MEVSFDKYIYPFVLTDCVGNAPPAFPATRGHLANYTILDCDNLLLHYNIPAVGLNVVAKRNLLRVHLNIPIPEFS
jgi:hypothetical protein